MISTIILRRSTFKCEQIRAAGLKGQATALSVLLIRQIVRGWQVKVKGRDMSDVFFRSQILRFSNWLDAGGEEEGRI